MSETRALMDRDEYAKHSFVKLVEVSAGYAKTSMTISREHLNGLGGVHGAAIFTLADFAFAAAANSHGTAAVAINASISCLRAAKGKTLPAQAEEISRSRSLTSYSVRITDENQQLIAVFQGMVFRKGAPAPQPRTLEERGSSGSACRVCAALLAQAERHRVPKTVPVSG